MERVYYRVEGRTQVDGPEHAVCDDRVVVDDIRSRHIFKIRHLGDEGRQPGDNESCDND